VWEGEGENSFRLSERLFKQFEENVFTFDVAYVVHKRNMPQLLFHHHHHHVPEGLGLIPVPCILKMKLVPPALPRSSYVSSSLAYIVVLV
jgi:hypothetical protein